MTGTTRLYQAIHAQPQAVHTLLTDDAPIDQVARQVAACRRIFLVGTGTSYHAAFIGAHLLRQVAVEAWAIPIFEFVHYPIALATTDGVIMISHRGNKQYGNLALQHAHAAQAATIGITGKNSLMQGADVMIETVEQDASSTHSISYTASLTRIGQVAVHVARLNGLSEQAQHLQQGLERIPATMNQILANEQKIQAVAREVVQQQRRLYFIGAGPNTATAWEGALKAKEASYVTAEGSELEQAIHGPLVAVEANDLVIPIYVPGKAQTRMNDLLRGLSEIHPRLWLPGTVTDEQIHMLLNRPGCSVYPLSIEPAFPEELTPLLTVIPLQLLANFLAAERGTDADAFRLTQQPYAKAFKHIRL